MPQEQLDPKQLLGKPAIDLTIEVAKVNPQISEMVFVRYHPARLADVDLFWHFSREQILDGTEPRRLTFPSYISEGSQIGLISLVNIIPDHPSNANMEYIAHGSRHLPMLFLSVDPQTQNTQVEMVKQFLLSLEQTSGWILSASPNHYYYCGINLMTQEEWSAFMERARTQQISGVVVPAQYIDLSLRPKITREPDNGTGVPTVRPALSYATMRISRNNYISTEPVVVAAF